MWIQSGDTVQHEGKVKQVSSVDGLYGSASNVKVVIEDEQGAKETFHLMEFNALIEQKVIVPLVIKTKNSRAY